MFRSIRHTLPNLIKKNNCKVFSSFAPPYRLSQSFGAEIRNFSTNRSTFSSAGLVDADLKKVLSRELQYETEGGDNTLSEEMKEYISKLPFKIIDKAGEDEVKLVRSFGNEKVEVTFSIKDVEASPVQTIPGEEEIEEEPIPTPPIRATIDITKSGHGTVTVEALIQDGYFNIEVASFFKDENLAVQDSAEAEWKRHALYGGPIFNDLDEDLQAVFERYLEERGITTDLALFIPNYIQYKEQLEYLNWLSSVHDFVKA